MILLGLTGGPGAGKSLAASFFEKKGAAVISADEIGKTVINERPDVLRKLTKEFGISILNDNKRLDRRKLGRLVFGNRRSMLRLNQIIHPHLLRMLKSRVNELRKRGKYDLIVVDAALIYEWGIASWFDAILVVTAGRDIRIARLVRTGLSRSEAIKRIGSQIPQRVKAAKADYVIVNDSDKKRLKINVDRIVERLLNGEST